MDLARISGGSQPLLHIYPPYKKDGQWYGAIAINVRGEPVKLVASASHGLLSAAYEMLSRYVTFGGDASTGATGAAPAGSLRAQLQQLTPFLPQQGLTQLERNCVDVLQRAAQGCESCIDALQEIDNGAREGKAELQSVKACMNEILSQAMNRRSVLSQVASMSPLQFQAFLAGLSGL